jgi:hypothetical protein
MTLMLVGMVFSVLIGMVCRQRERRMRVLVLVVAAGMTTIYLLFASRFM